MTLGSLNIETQGYVPVLLEKLSGMSCFGTCWPLGGAWFRCRYEGIMISSYCLMFPEFKSSLMFSGFGFKLPASGFQFYFYSSLNNFKICMEIQKTSNSQSNLEKEEWNWRNQLA